MRAKLVCDLSRRFFGAICDHDARNAGIHEMPRGEFSHFARADQHDSAAFERVEDLLSEFDCHVTDRDCIRRNSRFSSDAFGDTKRVMDQSIENSTGGSGFDGE